MKDRDLMEITAPKHPHYRCRGYVTDEVIKSTGQLIFQLEYCSHGLERSAVMPGEYRRSS